MIVVGYKTITVSIVSIIVNYQVYNCNCISVIDLLVMIIFVMVQCRHSAAKKGEEVKGCSCKSAKSKIMLYSLNYMYSDILTAQM